MKGLFGDLRRYAATIAMLLFVIIIIRIATG